jgi:hypothetical protein
MNKMKYQAGGAVDSTDDISAEELKEIMQQQKDAEMDANMQKGMENYNKRRVGGGGAKGSKTLTPKQRQRMEEKRKQRAAASNAAAAAAPVVPESKPKPVDPEGMNMGGMVGYKKGGKVRGCGIATQGVRKARGSY